MALEYGYFDSEITGYDDEGMPEFDRAQTSDFMAAFFSCLISSGVLASPSTCFQVTAYDGMTVAIAPGYGFIKGRFAYDESTAYLTLEDAPTTGTYSRIDMIVLRANYADRLCEIVVKTGTAGTSPAEPELLQPTSGGDYYELCLAKITVNANVSAISQSNITDTRYNSDYCGAVAQLIESIDTSVLFEQFEAALAEFIEMSNTSYDEYVASMEAYLSSLQTSGNDQLESIVNIFNTYEQDQEAAFDEWFQKMKDQLSEDAAGALQLEIDAINENLDLFKAEITETMDAEVVKVEAALKGFDSKTTVFNDDGSITETDEAGYSVVTVFNDDGSITQTLYLNGEAQATKTTVFNDDGSITETAEWVTTE